VRAWFPQFELCDRRFCATPRLGQRTRAHSYWRGRLQPFQADSDSGLVVANMFARRTVRVYGDGFLEATGTDLAPYRVSGAAQLLTPYTIEVVTYAPPALPRIFALEPRLDSRTFPRVEHLNRDDSGARANPEHHVLRSRPDCDLCIVAPQDNVWSWESKDIAELIGYTAVWLGAYAAVRWGGVPEWPLPHAPHAVERRMLEIPFGAMCPCGSGYSYGLCCRPRDDVFWRSSPHKWTLGAGQVGSGTGVLVPFPSSDVLRAQAAPANSPLV